MLGDLWVNETVNDDTFYELLPENAEVASMDSDNTCVQLGHETGWGGAPGVKSLTLSLIIVIQVLCVGRKCRNILPKIIS